MGDDELKSFRDILESEREEINKKREGDGARPYAALCLSGGGIRSASFNLGLIQALARERLLDKFDYLSTVSGGGYIGAWLTAWLQHSSIDQVVKDLTTVTREKPEPEQVLHLRRYSNYLTPRLGLASADGLVAAATGIRNLVLNGLQIWPFVIALMLLPLAVFTLAFSWERPSSDTPGMIILVLGLGCLCSALLCQLSTMEFQDGSQKSEVPVSPLATSYRNLMSAGMALLLLGWTLLVVASTHPLLDGLSTHLNWPGARDFHAAPILLILLLAFAISAVAAGVASGWKHSIGGTRGKRKLLNRKLLFWVVIAIVCAGIESQLIYFFVTFDPLWNWTGAITSSEQDHCHRCLLGKFATWGWTWPEDYAWLSLPFFLVFAYPITLLLQVICNWVFTGCSSRVITDASREWLARADGIQLGTAAVFSCWFAISLGSPLLGDWILGNLTTRSDPWAWMLATFGPTASAIGVWFGQSARTSASANGTDTKRAKSAKDKIIDFVGSLCMPLAAITFLLAFAYAGYSLVNALSPNPQAGGEQMLKLENKGPAGELSTVSVKPARPACSADATVVVCPTISVSLPDWFSKKSWLPLFVVALLATVGWLSGWAFNVNRYSLFGFYRERLARAYLGGARAEERKPDPATGFDAEDNIPFSKARRRPLHVINAGLNLGSSGELAWQERKAMSFTFSPLHSGSAQLSRPDGTTGGAYRDTSCYAGGITLAGAMAISGAAANPNMGYHSSPALSFLLTICDVRLGAWLGNPARDGYRRKHPGGALEVSGTCMLNEALGQVDASSTWINLSDGGHFENLGLYEMVRRGCKLIVASDASADREGSFDDLGRAFRLIRTDLGIEFEELVENGLPEKPTKAPDPDKRGSYRRWRLFRIQYPTGSDAPGRVPWPDNDTSVEAGYLLYFKTVLLGDEPQDVRYYASTAPDFPHESTGDQFFSESQFESYRKLGEVTLPEFSRQRAATPPADSPGALLATFLTALNSTTPAQPEPLPS